MGDSLSHLDDLLFVSYFDLINIAPELFFSFHGV